MKGRGYNPIGDFLASLGGEASGAAEAAKPHEGTISLGTTWTGEAAPWTQEVTVTGATVTARSAVTLCPTAAQLAQMIEDGVTALVIDNDAGALTVSALGAPTSVAMTVACLVQETVEAET